MRRRRNKAGVWLVERGVWGCWDLHPGRRPRSHWLPHFLRPV